MLNANRILVLAPHTDDGELGCGASLHKYISAGKQVLYAAFSSCAESLPPGLPPDTLITECKNATTHLGISETVFFDFPVRRFSEQRQDILEAMVQLNKKWKPEAVLLPSKGDVHQDHRCIFEEGMRAFKNCNLLGYELPWNNTTFSPTYFETISDDDVNAKIEAVAQYKSQSHRSYTAGSFLKSSSLVRGMQCGQPFAEAFETYRLIS